MSSSDQRPNGPGSGEIQVAEAKACPACGESIKVRAVLCRYCGFDFRTLSMSRGVQASPPVQTKTNGMAVAALVLGIVWLYGIGSILALVFGYSGQARIDRSQGRETGRGMAVAGIVLGWIGLASVLTLVALLVAGPIVAKRAQASASARLANSVLRNADAAARTCFTDADSFNGCTASELATIEPSLTYVDAPTPSADPEMVSIGVADGGKTWSAAVMAGDGTCYVLTDNASGSTIKTLSGGQSCSPSRVSQNPAPGALGAAVTPEAPSISGVSTLRNYLWSAYDLMQRSARQRLELQADIRAKVPSAILRVQADRQRLLATVESWQVPLQAERANTVLIRALRDSITSDNNWSHWAAGELSYTFAARFDREHTDPDKQAYVRMYDHLRLDVGGAPPALPNSFLF